MKKIAALMSLVLIASCGADGAPTQPDVGVSTKVGVNSKSGAYSDTNITIRFP